MNKITSALMVRFTAALLASATLTGCSLLKVNMPSGDPLPSHQIHTRTMTRGFYHDFSRQVSVAADSIVAVAPLQKTRLAAMRWKIQATRAGVSAAMQSNPDVSLADMWILCIRQNKAFEAAPDSLLFGAQSPIARATAKALVAQVEELADEVLSHARYTQMSIFVEKYMADNPTRNGSEHANTTLEWMRFLSEHGTETAYATGSIPEVLADVSDRLSSQTQQVANTIGWSKDMIEIQLGEDSMRFEVMRQLDSLERSFARMAAVAENLPEVSGELMAQFNAQVAQLMHTIDHSVNNAFLNLDHQRTALQGYISSERESIVKQAEVAVDKAIERAMEGLPALIGKVLLYVVLSLVVLLGLPFWVGFLVGRKKK